MTSRDRRRMIWPFLAGAALVVTLGGPAFGAISSIWWSYAADGNDPQRVALETYETIMRASYNARHGDYRDRRSGYVNPPILRAPECGGEAANRFDDGTVNLTSAIDHFRGQRLSGAFDGPAVEALGKLPSPMLGALSGCIESSLFSGFCARYAVGVSDAANRAATSALRRETAVIARQVDEMWCAAARLGTRQSHRN